MDLRFMRAFYHARPAARNPPRPFVPNVPLFPAPCKPALIFSTNLQTPASAHQLFLQRRNYVTR